METAETTGPIKGLFAKGNSTEIMGVFCPQNGDVTNGIWEMRLDFIKMNNRKTFTCCVESSLVNCYNQTSHGVLESRGQTLAIFNTTGETTIHRNNSNVWLEINSASQRAQFYLRDLDTDIIEDSKDHDTVLY
jgi:hypothetical protein